MCESADLMPVTKVFWVCSIQMQQNVSTFIIIFYSLSEPRVQWPLISVISLSQAQLCYKQDHHSAGIIFLSARDVCVVEARKHKTAQAVIPALYNPW